MVAVFVCDLLSKYFAFSNDRMSDMTVIPHALGFIQHKNYGIVANIPIPFWLIILISCLIFLVINVVLVISIRRKNTSRIIALSLILAGAVGNFYDRITFHYVRDWIHILNWSVINIADIAIFVGIVLLLFMKEGGHNVVEKE